MTELNAATGQLIMGAIIIALAVAVDLLIELRRRKRNEWWKNKRDGQ